MRQIKHKAEYEHWIGQGCNDAAVQRQFDRDRGTIRNWRAAEDWDARAAKDNAKLAKTIVDLRERRVAKYAEDTWDRLEALATVLAHEYVKLQERCLKGANIDAGELRAITAAESNYQQAARTFLGLDNIKIALDGEIRLSADVPAIRARLLEQVQGLEVVEVKALPKGKRDV